MRAALIISVLLCFTTILAPPNLPALTPSGNVCELGFEPKPANGKWEVSVLLNNSIEIGTLQMELVGVGPNPSVERTERTKQMDSIQTSTLRENTLRIFLTNWGPYTIGVGSGSILILQCKSDRPPLLTLSPDFDNLAFDTRGRVLCPLTVPEGSLLEVQITPPEVVLEQGSAVGQFEAKDAIGIQLRSLLSRWQIYCVAEPVAGPGGAQILPEELFILPSKSPDNPGKNYTGPSFSLEQPVVVAEGDPTGGSMVEVNALHLNAQVDPYKPPGMYHGKINVLKKDKWKDKKKALGEINFSLSIPEYANVSMGSEGLQFGSLLPGIQEAIKPVPLQVQTNYRVRVRLEILELRSEDGKGIIPASNISLGGGDTPQEAQRDARKRPFGENSFTWKSDPGIHTIYVFCRIKVTLDIPAGKYSGMINVIYEKSYKH